MTAAVKSSLPNGGDRLATCFARAKAANRAALVNFITAGDPDYQTSLNIARAALKSGTDILELGMPFSDPMADGPVIQAAGQRALQAGQTLVNTLALAQELRHEFPAAPIILMGYYNPIYQMGVGDFIKQCITIGIDGLIVVDLPPEEDGELCNPCREAGLHFIRLTAPTSDDVRLPRLVKGASGFLYYISVLGITGGAAAQESHIAAAVKRLKSHSDLPVVVGFGIKSPSDAARVAAYADGVVIGSALIETIASELDEVGRPRASLIPAISDKVAKWAAAMAKPEKS